MGLLDAVVLLAGIIKEEANNPKLEEDVYKWEEIYSYREDDALMRIAKRGEMAQRMAAMRVLKDRGYDQID